MERVERSHTDVSTDLASGVLEESGLQTTSKPLGVRRLQIESLEVWP